MHLSPIRIMCNHHETSGKEIDSMTEKTYEYYIEQERAIAE